MPEPRAVQLTFVFTGRDTAGLFRATRPLLRHRSRNNVFKKLEYVRRFFPEFGREIIRVGLTRVASGMAIPGGHEIWFNPSQISFHAIAHEFVHLLQGRHGIPTGERSCDLFSLARDWTLNDTAPYYLSVPRRFIDENGHIDPHHARLIYTAAKQAIELRQRGLRNYISYFERTLAKTDTWSGLVTDRP